MTASDTDLVPLTMQLSRTRASTIDVHMMLGSVCSAVVGCVGIGGVVLLLAEPLDGCRISASDDRAGWIGATQLRAEVGPLASTLRTGRPMMTADITRIGPPAMAAAAAECGLVSSFVVPFGVDGKRIGALQMLGEARRPVEPGDADLVRFLLAVVAARLADVRDLRLAFASRVEPEPSSPIDDTGAMVPLPREDAAGPHGMVVSMSSGDGDLRGDHAAGISVSVVRASESNAKQSVDAPHPTPRPRPEKHSWFEPQR